MSIETIRNRRKEVINHRFTCDFKKCRAQALNGLQHPDLPDRWGQVRITIRDGSERLCVAELHTCPVDMDALKERVPSERWKGIDGAPVTPAWRRAGAD